ncbi:MAG: hypothetical protein BWY21_00321 [Parcubacteria group bacterium ADurb.Bin216]|nr:MAG: hypothetical protein BWY21_00321 [Parcubacteria group bacterium ADurb.Bin216]
MKNKKDVRSELIMQRLMLFRKLAKLKDSAQKRFIREMIGVIEQKLTLFKY